MEEFPPFGIPRKRGKLVKGANLQEALELLSKENHHSRTVVVQSQNEYRVFSVGGGSIVERTNIN